MIAGTITSDQVRLASDVADEFFPNIICDAYGEDRSWLATMRVLLPSRLPAGETAKVRLMEGVHPADFLHDVDLESPNTITVVSLSTARDDMETTAKRIIKAGIPGHEFCERIYHRFHDQARPEYDMIFVRDDIANSVIVTNNMTTHQWHIFQTFVRTYFKELFQSHPLTEEESAMLRCFYKADANMDHYRALMREFEKPYDFRTAAIKKSLAGFASNAKRRRLANVENQAEELASNIRSAQNRIRELTARRDKLLIEAYGLRFSAGDSEKADEELLQYFLGNKSLVFTDSSGNYFRYWVKGELTYWDDQVVDSYVSTTSGYLYSGCDDYDVDKRKFQCLLRDIFVERKVKVLMAAAFRFRMTPDSVGVEVEEDADRPVELEGYLLNPHLMGYSCWGSHADNLADATARGDIVDAVAVTVAATAQITIYDSAASKFSEWLCESEEKCLLLPDGQRMTCKEYLETL